MPTSDAWRPQAAKNVGLNPTFPSLNEEIYPEYEMGLRLNLTKTQLIEVPTTSSPLFQLLQAILNAFAVSDRGLKVWL